MEVKIDSGLVKLEPFSIKLETDIEKKEKVGVKKENVDVKDTVNVFIQNVAVERIQKPEMTHGRPTR